MIALCLTLSLSFFSPGRANYVPVPVLLSCLSSLKTWICDYLQGHEASLDTTFLSHRILYIAIQALLYILCFKLEKIVEFDKMSLKTREQSCESILRALDIYRVISNPFLPCKV